MLEFRNLTLRKYRIDLNTVLYIILISGYLPFLNIVRVGPTLIGKEKLSIQRIIYIETWNQTLPWKCQFIESWKRYGNLNQIWSYQFNDSIKFLFNLDYKSWLQIICDAQCHKYMHINILLCLNSMRTASQKQTFE